MSLLGAVRARHATEVTPSDATDLPAIAHGLYVGGTGDLTILCELDADEVTLVGVPAGFFLSGIRIRRVFDTGTDATGIVAFY